MIRIATITAGLLLLIGLQPSATNAGPHGSPSDGWRIAQPQSEDDHLVVEVDRRSHPAIDRGWAALLESRWSDPALLDLPFAGARLLHADQDWALLWLTRSHLDRLRAEGVRLNPPRPRPPSAPRIFTPGTSAKARDLALDQSLADAVNQEQMIDHLDQISTALMTRYYNTPEMDTATQYVFDRFTEYGLDQVYFDNFTYSGNPTRNVVGVKTGSVDPDRIIMICAHLDAISPEPQTLAPGAEDNGSGSVGVMEAARLLAPLETEATVYFVCFSAEEVGLVGSENLAQIADQENWNLQAVLNMDMVGFDTAGSPDIWLEGFYSNPASIALLDLLENVANVHTDLSVYRYPNDGWGSDHVPFNNHGFPSMLAIDYDWNNYPCYHQTCDVVDNLVPAHLRKMVAVVTVAGAQMAGLTSGLGAIDGIADRTDSPDDEGITIEIPGTAYTETISGAGGTFTFGDLLPGTYTVRASALGYATAEVAVTIVAGQSSPVTILLDPELTGVVRGTVDLDEGGGAVGAVVFASGQDATTQAAGDGSYVLDPVYPGEVVINANYAGRMPGISMQTVPEGGELNDVDFVLKAIWDFEGSPESLSANDGWEWGSDGVAGAHSGSNVWGTRLDRDYVDCSDYRLDLPLDLTFYEAATLHYWHWYEVESTYDGGNLQVSTNGGSSWTPIVPVGGYPDFMRGSCNPLADQNGFGGQSAGWEEVVVDLADYAGQAILFRFWFGSDGGLRQRGWYLDDFSLEGTMVPTDAADGSDMPVPPLGSLTVHPNPARGEAFIGFRLGVAAPTWVSIFDAGGRRVRSLAREETLPFGEHSIRWDGRGDDGRKVAAGAYWAMVYANGRTARERVTVLR